ncbi:cytochrome P450 [Volvox carteri f. nagariensis]|uniref:Cytochrome P450 n=1 Tax=Volvox carteri f. nagariensis TaxID=3068 RepID=D8UG56_VOLCA|nr:cytochrome P450 [Volvox carteri f. nagariensis]EFJ41317.1 cytochrome P450 [Volvox carteri f. nagariensis]|eukprot:XP_002957651.1 cytochrome P450 [Volvox carteri f. nagariensis]
MAFLQPFLSPWIAPNLTSRKSMLPARRAATYHFVLASGNSSVIGSPRSPHACPTLVSAPWLSARAAKAMPLAASALDASTSTAAPDQQTSKCPFSQLASKISAATGAVPATSVRAAHPAELQPIPGPAPLSLEALKDVSIIFLEGLHVAMLRFSDKYGPICRFANPASLNGATSWVFLNSPENIQHVCATNVRNYSRRYLPDIYTYVTHGKGILGSQDEYNARHRRLCSGPFRSRTQLQRFSKVVVERWVSAVGGHLGGGGPGGGLLVTDVAIQTQRLTLDVVGRVAFSHDFRQVEQVRRDLAGAAGDSGLLQDQVLWAVNTFGEVLAQIFITPLPLLRVLDRLGLPHLRRLDEAVSIMRRAMLDVIQERRTALAAGLPGRDDLLQALLTATDDAGRGLSDEELWEDVHDIMGAGHETTATTTAALLYCISAHPDVRQRVEQELDDVLAPSSMAPPFQPCSTAYPAIPSGDQPPSCEALERLPYLQACVKECMRLYPAIPVFPRETLSDDVLPSGHAVSAGDVVFMSSYALGRSAALWPDPLTFNPDRFTPEGETAQHRFQWLPFGAGPRMCLGASFALRFRFTPLRPNTPILPVAYDITMNFNPSAGLHMRAKSPLTNPACISCMDQLPFIISNPPGCRTRCCTLKCGMCATDSASTHCCFLASCTPDALSDGCLVPRIVLSPDGAARSRNVRGRPMSFPLVPVFRAVTTLISLSHFQRAVFLLGIS